MYGFGGLGLTKESSEIIFLKILEDILHRLQMFVGIILGTQKEYDRVGRLLVER
jgi:hypothetical protein